MGVVLRRLLLAVASLLSVLPVLPAGRADAALAAPVVAIAATTSGNGTFLAARDGGVFTAGDARFRGSMGGRPLAAPIVGMAADPDGDGYWLVASDGGVFAFAAPFLGSMGGQRLAQPIVGMTADPDGRGYALVARDGGVFTFGSFAFRGSTGAMRLNRPVVGMAADPDGDGYWVVASDGGIFSFGAPFHGSLGARTLNAPITGMTPSARGYWLVATDGGVFTFGDARFFGSRGGTPLPGPVVGMAARITGAGYWLASSDGSTFPFGDATVRSGLGRPALSVSVVRGGLSIPWDVDVTPGGVLVYTERAGRLWARAGGVDRVVGAPPDVSANSEGGMLGVAIDPQHATNRRIYVCQTTAVPSGREVRLYAWELSPDGTAARRLEPALVSGIPSTTGRHNGCRPEIGPDGFLWIGTGDAATCNTSQDRANLGGKVLRVDRLTGAPAPGNPFGNAVYTYGHRNVQGLAFRPGTSQVFSVEHGPDRDDEVTVLRAGGNAGWAPGCPYDESVPMTDRGRFPDAMVPAWASGSPTVAPSGATFLSGAGWGAWQGALAVAMLRGEHLRILTFDAEGRLTGQEIALSGQGRLRSVTLDRDGSLLVTTADGGGTDRILRITPS